MTNIPIACLIDENQARGGQGPEFELLDTGIFDEDRYFDIVIEYAKATPEDMVDPDRGVQSRARCRALAHPAAVVVPQYLGLGKHAGRPSPRSAEDPEPRWSSCLKSDDTGGHGPGDRSDRLSPGTTDA